MDEHPLITLLVKRMESHPHEFVDPPLRWESIIRDMNMHAREADREKMQRALSDICMDKLHEVAMDELLNGDERRRAAEQQKLEWEKQQIAKQAAHARSVGVGGLLTGQAAQPNLQAGNPYANQLSSYSQMAADQLNVAQGLLDEFRGATGIHEIFDDTPKPLRRGLFGKRR